MDSTLILGVGNEFRRDDGVGPRVAEAIARLGPPGVEVRLGASLPGSWDGYDRVYIVDAIASGSEPGTVHRLNAAARPLPSDLFRLSSHAFGIVEAVELARRLGRLPGVLVVYGIEGREFGEGRGLTPEVSKAAQETVGRLMREIGP